MSKEHIRHHFQRQSDHKTMKQKQYSTQNAKIRVPNENTQKRNEFLRKKSLDFELF